MLSLWWLLPAITIVWWYMWLCNALRIFDKKSWKPDGIASPPLSAKSQELEPCKLQDISQTMYWSIIHFSASFFHPPTHPSIHPSIRPSIQPSIHLSRPLVRRWWRLHFQGCTEVSASSPPPSSNHTRSLLPDTHSLIKFIHCRNSMKDNKYPETDGETRMMRFDER